MAGGDTGVLFGLLERMRRALNHQSGRGNEFTDRKAGLLVEFVSHLLEVHLVGNDEHQHVKSGLKQIIGRRPVKGKSEMIKHTDGRPRLQCTMLRREGVVHDAFGIVVHVLSNLKANPLGVESRDFIALAGGKQERTGGGKQEENNEHACTQAVGNSSHGQASCSCPLSVRS